MAITPLPFNKPIQMGVTGAFGRQVTPASIKATPKPKANTNFGVIEGLPVTTGIVSPLGPLNLPTKQQIQQAQPTINQERKQRIQQDAAQIKKTNFINKQQIKDILADLPEQEREGAFTYLVDKGYTIEGWNDPTSKVTRGIKESAIGQKVTESIKKTGEKLQAAGEAPTIGQAGLRVAGGLVGGATDVIGSILSGADDYILGGAVKKRAKELAENPIVAAGLYELSKGIDAYNDYMAQYPELKKDIEATIDIASIVPAERGVALLGGAAKKIKSTMPSVKGISKVKQLDPNIRAIIVEPTTISTVGEALGDVTKGTVKYEPRKGLLAKAFGQPKLELEPSKKAMQAEKIILDKIPDASPNPQVLNNQLKQEISNMSKPLADELSMIRTKSFEKDILNAEKRLLDLQTDRLELLPLQQKQLKALIKDIPKAKTANDLWDIAKAYDNAFPASVKNNPSSLAYEAYQQGRREIRSLIDKMAKDVGSKSVQKQRDEMSALYTAQKNIELNLGRLIKGTPGFLNVGNVIKGSVGAAGLGGLSNVIQ